MGFEISDDTLLRVSGVGAVAYCAFAMAAPREFTNTFMTAVGGAPRCVSEGWDVLLPPRCHRQADAFRS